jgi:hypothetical protein
MVSGAGAQACACVCYEGKEICPGQDLFKFLSSVTAGIEPPNDGTDTCSDNTDDGDVFSLQYLEDAYMSGSPCSSSGKHKNNPPSSRRFIF